MTQLEIHLNDSLPYAIGDTIVRPREEVVFETYGAVVQWTDDRDLVIPWHLIRFIEVNEI